MVLPDPKVTPPLEAAPGLTFRTLAPMLEMLFRMAARRPRADFHHSDDSSHADYDAQGGQHGPQWVAQQRLEGRAKCPIGFHGTCSA